MPAEPEPLTGLPPRLVDASLAALTAVGTPTLTALFGGRVEVAGAVPLGLLLGALLLVRRRWPVVVLAVSVMAVIALRTGSLTDVGWIWPASVAYFTAAAQGRLRWAVGIGVVELCLAVAWEGFVAPGVGGGSLAAVGAETLWLAFLLAAGNAYRHRQRWRAESVARLRQLDHEREVDARRRRAEERLRIARELHDVVAHTLAVVGVHVNVAADALDDSPADARAALRLADEARGRAMADLRSLISIMRDEATTLRDEAVGVPAPQPDLGGLAGLVASARAAGLDARLREDGDPAPVPAPVALAAYRVVQEALTNTLKHAHASRATVELRYRPDEVVVEVIDDGRGGTDTPAAGLGLTGMRERVAALGGSLRAEPGPDGGFRIRAAIPVADSPR
ncbi:MAG TPA: sensor histidine kinase [Pilimelia sp.]|nr:sensor histidine kinase [Pilimelia sp.]